MDSDAGSIAVLVPARNAAHRLPDWLASVARFADVVVALDDGSTDATRETLERHPLVGEVLTNPVRASYVGWDDLANRQRLVDAARRTGARWYLFLDADERIDARDAAALRRFVEREAQPGFAYGFEVFRMVEDALHYDPRSLWVFRLFSAVDAATSPLGSQRLHFVPVPSGIPQHRWLYTSVRIQHEGSLTTTHRRARFQKYREADPTDAFDQDYRELLADPRIVAAWPDRAVDLPVLLGTVGRYVDQLSHSPNDRPAISAVVIARDDRGVIDRSLGALVTQDVGDEFEIIVVCSGTDGTSEHVAAAYPTVRCIQLPHHALPGEARNAGLWAARGEYVTFPGSHVWLRAGSLRARLDAHEQGWELVTGSVLNGNPTLAGWASYFLDHATQSPSQPPGEYEGVPGHASYVTSDVRDVGGFPEDMRAGEDTVVNQELYYAGRSAILRSRRFLLPREPVDHLPTLGAAPHPAGPGTRADHSRRPGRRPERVADPRHRIDTRAAHAGDPHRDRLRRRGVSSAVPEGSARWSSPAPSRPRARRGSNCSARGPSPSTAPAPVRPAAVPGLPILAIGGRPGEAACGLLSAGRAYQAAERLMTFTRYARTVREVRPRSRRSSRQPR